MVFKYLRRKQYSIDSDYQYYLGKEGLYGILLGHHLKPKQVRKANYIWNALLAQEGRYNYIYRRSERRRRS
jgi:hypothetical protein